MSRMWIPLRKYLTLLNTEREIIKEIKQRGQVVYGARAIQKHIGFMARSTVDYDVYSKTPKRSANRMVRRLNKVAGKNTFYSKPAIHPGTHKLYWDGYDNKRGTNDDVNLADYSKQKQKRKTVVMDGVKYTHLSESIKDKKKSLSDPTYKFRWGKDRDDLDRIKLAKKFGFKWRKY